MNPSRDNCYIPRVVIAKRAEMPSWHSNIGQNETRRQSGAVHLSGSQPSTDKSGHPRSNCRTRNCQILVVSPGLIEPATRRGGGIEEIDSRVASQLSKHYAVVIVGPFYGRFVGLRQLSDSLTVLDVGFPALADYLPKSRWHVLWATAVATPVYCVPLAFALLRLMTNEPQILVVHNGFPGLVGTILGKIRKRQVIFSEGNTYPWANPFVKAGRAISVERLSRRILTSSGLLIAHLADTIRAQSAGIKEAMIAQGVPGAKIHTIPAGTDTSAFMPRPASEDLHQFRVGFVGRLTVEKGAALLVQLVEACAEKLPLLRFVIVGDGPYRRILDGRTNIERIGWVPSSDVARALVDVDAVVTFQEEFGLGELEAMAAGKAVVARDTPGVRTCIRNFENGILCTPAPESYVEALTTLVGDFKLRSKVSRNARLTAETMFDWRVIGDQWLKLVQALLEADPTNLSTPKHGSEAGVSNELRRDR